MPLTNTLNTNEVKDRAGVEVEYTMFENVGRTKRFKKVSEAPNLQDRLSIRHEEIGTGVDTRRRSNVRFDLQVVGTSGKTRTCTAHLTTDFPIGDIGDYNTPKDVLARLLSFESTTGAGTTVLFDGSGTGAQIHLNGEL